MFYDFVTQGGPTGTYRALWPTSLLPMSAEETTSQLPKLSVHAFAGKVFQDARLVFMHLPRGRPFDGGGHLGDGWGLLFRHGRQTKDADNLCQRRVAAKARLISSNSSTGTKATRGGMVVA